MKAVFPWVARLNLIVMPWHIGEFWDFCCFAVNSFFPSIQNVWEFSLLSFLGLFFNILPFDLESVSEGIQYFEDWLFWRQNTSILHSMYWPVTTSLLPISLHCKEHSLSSKEALPHGWRKAECTREWESSRGTCYCVFLSFLFLQFQGKRFHPVNSTH